MINRNKVLLSGLSALIALNIAGNNLFAQSAEKNAEKTAQTAAVADAKNVNPVELVSTPQAYLNSKVKIVAKFDKFSTLGLDYKPAMRDSKEYISLLIRRPDVADHTIPLSELKLIVQRDKAEKLLDLESGDEIELIGQVFSTALNDPWVDVSTIKLLTVKAKSKTAKKNVEGSKEK